MNTRHPGAGSVFPGAHLPLDPKEALASLNQAREILPPLATAELPAWLDRLRDGDAGRPLMNVSLDGSRAEVRLSEVRHVGVSDIKRGVSNGGMPGEAQSFVLHEGRYYTQSENTPAVEIQHNTLAFDRLPGGLESLMVVAEAVRTGIVVGSRFWEFDAQMSELYGTAQ